MPGYARFAYDFELSSQFASYIGSIVTSDKNVGHFSTENLEGYTKKPSLLTIGVNEDNKLYVKGKIDIFFETRFIYPTIMKNISN